ncbi:MULTISPECIES: tannase/feruloyl esterase family alpha/beta hydrolase [Paraburkholderia]|uniref:Tannase/feruloyl esterase family alpha/beta hydrolase n=1 Tax=Paraburkholderia dipogonis TaxID=1211383 RepID=A0A4Y8MH44_9BURK|nr:MULTISPECIES: tannase/feruloyl esterase family alpha/beta hydrolase [Paraburkholderia]RKR31328.1 feruloyl esterase [Paraburkholderia sp. BL17N1]TFE36703.1 tannase/feruloyl esterase family alpha/beta hydrolase [Paraburkholderia dipogonis]
MVHIRVQFLLFCAFALSALSGCGNGSSDLTGQPVAALSCDQSIASQFKPDAQTKVILVKHLNKGDPLPQLYVEDTVPSPQAMCVVKLMVGPGNPGPAGAPSTSPGIGMEIWLPEKAAWTGRLVSMGNGGWAGSAEGDPTQFSHQSASDDYRSLAQVASEESVVTVGSDAGHNGLLPGQIDASGNASFAMNPDGTLNATLWNDFAQRANYQQTLMAKALARAYYGKDPQYTYWDGGSTGGRQGLKQAQLHPEEYDGIVAGYPAINWTRFMVGQTYPSIVVAQDLGGHPVSSAQSDSVAQAAMNACDVVGGQHLGYMLDPSMCKYDPTKDVNVLCVSDGGKNATASCVTKLQATAMNKFWYGMTADGSVPDPAVDSGWGVEPGPNQRWFGSSRSLSPGLSGDTFSIFNHFLALALQNSAMSDPTFVNATGNGQNLYKQLSYAQLNNAFDRGVALNNTAFAEINTDDPDLSAFKARGGKLIHWQGMDDNNFPVQGSINYYSHVLSKMGGIDAVQSFYRFSELAGNGHGYPAFGYAPTPARGQMLHAMFDWVEKGIPPDGLVLKTGVPGTLTGCTFSTACGGPVQKSLPLCFYPKKATFVAGDPNTAASYSCQ